jgi:cyclopropane-fatty-acyl-phospholipid synthase
MARDPHPLTPAPRWTGPAPEQGLYHTYPDHEDRERTNRHYDHPTAFFYPILGGAWQVYSCNLWAGATTDTESQEAKLDLLARAMGLRPGQRILDVGCAWGGPLVYLSTRYRVEGVGLTLSPTQKRAADRRIAEHRANAAVLERHWRAFEDERGFDAVFTDEAITHFNDLGAFFAKVHALLRPGGVMVNKELHYTSSRYAQFSRADTFVSEVFGATGNYRTLGEELVLLDQHGFAVQRVEQIPMEHYQRTADRWLTNMHQHRAALQAAVGLAHYRRFRTYLKIVRKMTNLPTMSLDVVAAARL